MSTVPNDAARLSAISLLLFACLVSPTLAQSSNDSKLMTSATLPSSAEAAKGADEVPGDTEVSAEEVTLSDVGQFFPNEFRTQKHFILYDYQWIGLLAVIFLGFVTDRLVRWILRATTKTWLKFMGNQQVDSGNLKLWRPLGLLSQALVWYWGTILLGLPEFIRNMLLYGLQLFTILAAVWTAFLIIDLIAVFLAKKTQATDTKFDDLLIPLLSKSLKVFVVCMGVVSCAQAFNLPIAGLLGGLGIGGAAIAFASKDAIANFFGSVTVLTDRPFEIGDWIKTEGVEGTVEAVGFRSSRIRTFYNSQVTLPNSLLTTAVVDNMGRRRYRRITATLGVQYDTHPDQIEAFCEGIRELIRRHPYTRKDSYHVYLNGFDDSSLNIMLYCFVECPDWSVELREKHRLYVDIIRLAERLEVSFAFPTRTLYLHQEEQSVPTTATDLQDDPDRLGQQLAADIAGPLLPPDQRPGGVQFRGPSSLDN